MREILQTSLRFQRTKEKAPNIWAPKVRRAAVTLAQCPSSRTNRSVLAGLATPVLAEQACDMKRANHPPAERTTLAVQHGVLGVDFNVDHLALAETDLYGNMLRKLRLPLLREDASAAQCRAV